jgi:hypothetical protein
MVRAQSMPRLAGRASCLRRTSSFRAEPYEPQKPVELGIVMHLGRVHIACARIAAHRLPSAPTSGLRVCSRDARWVRSVFVQLLRLAPLTPHRSRSCTVCSSITRRSSAFSLQLEATHRARAPQWLGVNWTDSDVDMRMDHRYPCEWLLADPDQMSCIHNACEQHSV